jgi:hypothetical protein
VLKVCNELRGAGAKIRGMIEGEADQEALREELGKLMENLSMNRAKA